MQTIKYRIRIIDRRITCIETFEGPVATHAYLIMQVLASPLHFLSIKFLNYIGVPPLLWPVSHIKIEGHVERLISGRTCMSDIYTVVSY